MIRPAYDAVGEFMGFTLWLGEEWSVPQPYKRLMLAIRDSGVEPIYIPEKTFKRLPWGGYGEL